MSSQLSHELNVIVHLTYQHTKNNRFELANSLFKIFHKIIKYPNKSKYKDLNYHAIYYRFDQCELCIVFFTGCGFDRSNDEKRLIFNQKKLKILTEQKKFISSSLSELINAANNMEIPVKYLLSVNEYVIYFCFLIAINIK